MQQADGSPTGSAQQIDGNVIAMQMIQATKNAPILKLVSLLSRPPASSSGVFRAPQAGQTRGVRPPVIILFPPLQLFLARPLHGLFRSPVTVALYRDEERSSSG